MTTTAYLNFGILYTIFILYYGLNLNLPIIYFFYIICCYVLIYHLPNESSCGMSRNVGFNEIDKFIPCEGHKYNYFYIMHDTVWRHRQRLDLLHVYNEK